MNNFIAYACLIILVTACAGKRTETVATSTEEAGADTAVVLTIAQVNQMGLKTGAPEKRQLSLRIQTTGIIQAPPNSQAVVTAVMASKVQSIRVRNGQEVRRGQVLAYLSEPAITELQSRYMDAFHKATFLEKEYNRQKTLYDEQVGAGKTFQQVESEYLSARSAMKGLQQQLRQLGMNPQTIEKGNFYSEVAAVSPINGAITAIHVKTGQYVQPDKELFEIISTENLYAELQVFEKDIDKVSVGQTVHYRVHTHAGTEFTGKVYSIGKKFQDNPKALLVYASITNSGGKLIPGMYLKGEISESGSSMPAIPDDGVTRDGDQFFVFVVIQRDGQYVFTPVEVEVLGSQGGWSAIRFKYDPGSDAVFALNNAYQLYADLKKGELDH